MMSNEFVWILAFIWGILLGGFYFGGLWLTVCRLPVVKYPRRLWLTSFILRLLPTLLGMWAVLKVNYAAFFVTLATFFTVRIIMSKRIAPTRSKG